MKAAHSLPNARRRAALVAVLAAVSLAPGLVRSAMAASTAEELVETSRFSLERMLVDRELPQLKRHVTQARGLLIIPQLVKGGFILGAEGGSGVFMVRGGDGSWSAPTFYTLAAGSIGLQIGGQVSEAVFTVMNEGAVEALLSSEIKLGADLSITLGPMGKGLEASTTTNLSADIFAFSKAVGAFAGGALEGAKLFTRQTLNEEYYGPGATPRAIVMERSFFNPQAEKLRRAAP
ncbi:MAG: lipid-binding SYLF domain-containing protein [Alphaproteobacteria bacterium]